MYDSPKAIHFVAILNSTGKPLPRLDPSGLDIRWSAAELVKSAGYFDMLKLSPKDKSAIRKLLKTEFKRRKLISVELDLE